jgi:hypothetical protein
LIIVSIPALANAQQTTPSSFKQIVSQNSEKNPVQVSRHLEIALSENVGIASNDQTPGGQQNTNQKTLSQNKMVSLSDVVTISSNDNERNFVLVKPNVIQVTTLDRIWNPERIRINGRTITVDNQMSYDLPAGKLSSLMGNQQSSVRSAINFAQIDGLFSFVEQSEINLFSFKPIGLPFVQSSPLQNQITGIDHLTPKNETPVLVLLLIPVTGYILIRSSKNKIQTRSKQILSLCFSIIIISSIVTTPLSISAYWLAYAQSNLQNGSDQSNSSSANLSFNGHSNSTKVVFNGYSNSTNLSFNGYSNSTKVVFNGYSNSTNLSFNGHSNSTNISSNGHSNSTTPTPSWQLSQNSTSVNNATVTNNGTVVQLNGQNFLKQHVNSTRTLSALTISAWVKPDYSKGSPQFTVISKQNQFVLGINNIIPPKKIATFSVFDGIRWDTVNSTVPIQENWTHLAGTFNGSSISIYVNGTVQSTYHLNTIPTVTVNGTLTTKTVDNISSPSDIIIGAYLNTLRTQTSNLFSGSIQGVKLYDSLLNPSQIALLYTSDPLSQPPLPGLSTQQIQNKSLNFTDSILVSNTIQQSVPPNQSTPNKSLNVSDFILIRDSSNQSTLKQSTQYKSLSLTDSIVISDTSTQSAKQSTQNKSLNLTDSVLISVAIGPYLISNQSTKNKSLSLIDSVLINDVISQNGTSQDILQPQTITPELNSTRQTYLITETPQLQFKYLSDSAILKTTQKKIAKELVQLDNLEQKLNNTEALLNVTQSVKVSNYNVPQQSDFTKQQLVDAQQQITDTKHKIIQVQQQIQNALAQPLNHAQVNGAVNQILNVTQTLNQTRHQVIEAAQQIASARKDIKGQANQITQLSANITSDQGTVQQGSWHGQNETITVQVRGPDNNIIQVQPTVEKVLDGQFNITLSSTRDARPGLYQVDLTMIKDGKLFTAHDQFAWGLVSVNTMKSIYKPGEVANLVIVVLDNGGHSVCNSNVIMNIHDPSSGITTQTAGNGITPESQCGLYDAKYTTKFTGTYNIDITATNPSGLATFNTSFLVQSSYPFDVIRTADSKIDPVDNPNLFNVRLDFTSYSNATNLSIKESVPVSFNLTTDGAVQTIGDSKTITWSRNLIGNKTYVQYSYSVPLVYPQLYALGPVKLSYGTNSTFTEARPWFVAVDPQPYVKITLTNSQTSATPVPFQQKIVFNPSTYTSIEAANLGNIRFCADSACNTQLYSWLENCTPSSCTNAATSATAWVQLTSAIPANGGNQTIYMVFQSTSTNFDKYYWGRAAWIGGGTYGQYDNGRNVFTLYDNFTGTTLNSTKWTTRTSGAGGTVTVNNGITFTASTGNDWAFIISSMLAYPKIAEVNMTTETGSSSDPMMGVTTSTSVNGYVAPYNGYTIDNCVLTCTNGLSFVMENSTSGFVLVNNPSETYKMGIWNMTWAATGNEKGSDGNIVQSSADSRVSIANYGLLVGQSNVGTSSTNSAQMARMRDYPPNGVMPSSSLGGVNYSPVLSETVTITDSISTAATKKTTLSETVIITDPSVSAQIPGKPSETITITDSLSTVASKKITLSETVTATDPIVSTTICSVCSIVFDSTANSPAVTSGSGTITVSHNLGFGSGNKRIVIVGVDERDSSSSSTPTATYNGVSMTQVFRAANAAATYRIVTMFAILDANLPASPGTYNVVVSRGSTTASAVVGVESFTGVVQSIPSNTATASLLSLNPAQVSITTQNANSWLVDTIATPSLVSPLTAGGSQTQRWSVASSSTSPTVAGGGSTQVTTTAGSYTMSWTEGTTGNAVIGVAELGPSKSFSNSLPAETVTSSDSLSTAAAKKATLSETVTVTDSKSTTLGHNAQVSSILIDHVQTANGTATQIKISSFTIANDTNRYLLVGISTNGATVSSVTYGLSSLTSLISKSNTGVDTELWGLVNPPSGTADITVNLSSSATVVVGAYDLMGVDQSNPIPTTATGTSGVGGGNPQVPITNQYATSIVIDTETKLASSLSTTLPQYRTWNNQVGTTETGASSYIIPYVANTTNTFLWTASASGPKWTGVAVEVKASGLIAPSERVHVTDTLTISVSRTVSLTETVNAADSLSKSAGRSATLSETVTATDSKSTAATKKTTLSETVTATDQTVTLSAGRFARPPTETVTAADSLSESVGRSAVLSETVTVTDSVSSAATMIATLSETVTATDNLSTAATKKATLSETVTSTDSLSTSVPRSKTLSETVTVTDSVSTAATKKATLSETVTSTDSLITTVPRIVTLSETITTHDAISHRGGIKIEARDQNGILVPGATYAISPNPNGGATPMTVVDGGINDHDGANNGRVVVSLVPFAPYNVTMTSIPAGYNMLANYTIITVDGTNLNGTDVFRLIPTSFDLTTLPATVIIPSPDLNSSTLSTWMSNYNARQFNGTQPATQITTVQQLPPIISAGTANQAAISLAKAKQATVKLETNFAPLTDAGTIIKTLGVPTYSMPKSSNLVSVIPGIVAQAANLNVPTQTVTTPPLDKIVPGQQMIIPVNTGTIPNSGGLKELDVQSKSTATSTGNPPSDWFVVKANNQLPSYTPPLPQNDNIILYTNVTYQHEVTNTGFDWSNPANFASPPRLTLQVPKNPAGIQVDSKGCPISDIFLYDPSTRSWTTNTVTIISLTPSADNTNTCDVVVKAQHFSQFGLAGHSVGGGTGGAATGTGNAAAGAVGVGPSGAGAAAPGAFGGILATQLKIYQVSYDVCQNNTVKILVGYTGNNPTVFLRTSLTGVVQAQLAAEQPYAQENVKDTLQKLVYIAPIDKKEQSFEVVAVQAAGGNINSVGKTIEVTGCKETINFENPRQIQPIQIDLSAPRIFDLKFQLGNGTKIPSSATASYVNSQSIKVYGIVYSPTPIDRAELRFVKTGNPLGEFTSVKMETLPLISNTTYTISGVIPKEMVTAPAMTYWIDVHNSAQKTTDSDQYSIGVRPDYGAAGKLEMDLRPTTAEGTIAHPSAYFANNATGPLYGVVSLVVDGNVVYTSSPQLFENGQTRVNLEWKIPTISQLTGHKVQAVAEFYGQPFMTDGTTVVTFPASKSIPLSNMVPIETIYQNNSTIAKASILYSSFKNEGTMRFKVTAPDGTCVIGGSVDCLVTSSTIGFPGSIKSVIIGDQVYRVRYSGPDSALERFSITSVDPIVGPWKVEIDSQTGLLPQAQAMNDVFLKVKYRDFDTSLITVPSQ